MSNPDYAELLGSASRGRPKKFGKRIMSLRAKEQSRREATIKWRVMRALTHLHPDEVETLRQQARAIVDRESGPLPGDPGWEDPDA